MDKTKILTRIDELLSRRQNLQDYSAIAGELYHGTVTLLGLTHGETSQQLKAFNDAVSAKTLITLKPWKSLGVQAGCL